MNKEHPISERKRKLLDEKNSSELVIGEKVYVAYNMLNPNNLDDKKQPVHCTILNINNDTLKIKGEYYGEYEIKKSDILSRNTYNVGENPFVENNQNIRNIQYDLEGIIVHLLDCFDEKDDKYLINGVQSKRANWNPYIYDKNGFKQYYQRLFCWTIKDKQLLIDSIYNEIDCGKVLIRKRSAEELEKLQEKGETELAFADIVDGKQRMDAIRGFLRLEFVDSYGNYYSDLSKHAQHKILRTQLFTYSEMPENTKDDDVINQFLKLNFAGVPQSLEHINFVKSLRN